MTTTGVPTYHLAKYLAGLLGIHTDNSLQHMKNPTDFIGTLDSLHVGPYNIMLFQCHCSPGYP
jgi:hypothetical protein